MWTVGHSLARSPHLAECVWDIMDMVPGHLTQAFSPLPTHYTQPWVIKEDGMGFFPENPATGGWGCSQRLPLPEKTQEWRKKGEDGP